MSPDGPHASHPAAGVLPAPPRIAMPETETARTTDLWRRLWREQLAHQWKLLALSLAMTAVVSLATAGYSKLIQLVMAAFQSGSSSVIWWGPLGVILLSTANGAGQYLKEVTANRLTNRMETELRKTMFARLVGTDLARLQTEAPAGLAARFSADIGLIGGAVRAFLGGITGVLTILATFIVLLTIDWPLTLGICAVFALALVPVNRIGRRLRRLATRTQVEVAAMTSEVTEGVSGIRMARTYRLEQPLTEHAADVFERLFGLRAKQNRWQARISPLMEVLVGFAVAILLFVVGLRIQAGTITLADFTGLLTGLGVIASPARRLGGNVATVQQGAAALERVFTLFDVQNTILDGPDTIDRALGQIRFEDVGFTYADGHVAVDGFTLTIEPGMRVAFVGRSGAGKSTVFNLLPRLYDPTAGRILLDGHDLRSLTLASLRDQIAVVSQDSVLLSGTVARNIGFGRRTASRAEVEAAAARRRRRRVHPRPAGGLRHRGDADRRPVLRRRAPAAVDRPGHPARRADPAAGRADLGARRRERGADPRRARQSLARGRTTLVIAHRLATVLDSDLIVVMDRGRIVEQGTHAELLALRGLYADLYELQFAGVAG